MHSHLSCKAAHILSSKKFQLFLFNSSREILYFPFLYGLIDKKHPISDKILLTIDDKYCEMLITFHLHISISQVLSSIRFYKKNYVKSIKKLGI